ncbi:MAG: transcriptional regulator, LacI family [Actinomycetia bacterium]|nr:transcriptional regulator, LacI family [Actinomycetes bacterium]
MDVRQGRSGEIFAADCRPPLTLVVLNLERLGAMAVEHLLADLDGHHPSGVIRQPGRLIVRESTGPLPHRPPGRPGALAGKGDPARSIKT